MRDFIFGNKQGVTILEGLIALGLLALVSVGAFGVLLSVSRKSFQPDVREEVVLAVERAQQELQRYAGLSDFETDVTTLGYPKVCEVTTPLKNGTYDIQCMLPAICNWDTSSFTYTVSDGEWWGTGNVFQDVNANDVVLELPFLVRHITFTITCNGFTYEQ